MKNSLVLLVVFVLSRLDAQVYIRTNLLHTIPLHKSLTFEVRINKGTLSNFARYQLEVPPGIVIEEVESRTGTFSFENNKAKIIWVVPPASEEFGIRMKIKSVKTSQTAQFLMKYYYMDQDDKREFEAQAYVVNFKDTVLPVFLSAPMTTLLSKNPPPPVAAPVNPSNVNTKDPEQLKQQVAQLRKDSKEAFVVGEREKAAAELRLSAISEEEKKTSEITDEQEKKVQTEKLDADKSKAQDELAIAERVLTLAKSLDENANEIERINKSVNPTSFSDDAMTVPSTETPSVTIAMEPMDQPVPVNTVPPPAKKEAEAPLVETTKVETKKEAVVPAKKTVKPTWKDVAAFAEEPAIPGAGRVYMVQIGSFVEKPGIAQFNALGRVTVVNESNAFKVLIGRYDSKDEAYKKKAELGSKNVDGFVVTYEGGIRVK
ncbi:MAG: SPOR domain-containing protein [bacterium]|nr:SPOR domain-containing protein [bacterium]